MSWKKVKLGDILTESKIISEKPNPDRRITVRLKVLGVEKRGLENEVEGATKQYIRKAGQFIYGKQNFHKGAFGIIPPELDGFESSSDLPAFDVDKTCLPEFIFYFFKQGNFYLELSKIASGVATQRINTTQLFELELMLPDIKTQKLLISNIQLLEKNGLAITNELTHQLSLVKKLRQSFLQEAVQGKLVEQNTDDEPASELLKKIKAEKEKLIAEKKLKKEKALPPIQAEEIPFEIPEGWVWCRLGEICLNISTGPFGTMLHKSDYVSNGIPLVNPMNIVNEKIISSDKMMINESTRLRLKSYVLKLGDIVIGRRGEMGRCAVVTEKESGWICGTGSFFLQLHNEIHRQYFIKVLGTKFAKSILLGASVGSTMNNLNHKILSYLPIPLPNLSEQIRIVQKLDELMQTCDELEASIKESQAQNEKLLQQVLREALRR
jgi:type I restriction enzyme S subunit